MKKLLAAAAFLSVLTSCNHTDPVQFNDTMVKKMDSLNGLQAAFVEDISKMGDTAKVAYDKMNNYADKAIADINKLPEYDQGADFRKEVVQIINTLKTSNASQGLRVKEFYDRSNAGEELTDVDFNKVEQLSGEYDKIWEEQYKKFDQVQKTYAEKTGIKIQEVAAPIR